MFCRLCTFAEICTADGPHLDPGWSTIQYICIVDGPHSGLGRSTGQKRKLKHNFSSSAKQQSFNYERSATWDVTVCSTKTSWNIETPRFCPSPQVRPADGPPCWLGWSAVPQFSPHSRNHIWISFFLSRTKALLALMQMHQLYEQWGTKDMSSKIIDPSW
jgi:hypothetical protein